MNIAVWIASGLLAAAYLFIGGTKLLKSKERLAENSSTAGAAEALSATSIKLIGGVEVAGALAKAMGMPEIEPELVGKARIGDIRHCYADISHARATLGYEPEVELEPGMGEIAQWLEGRVPDDRVDAAADELTRRGLSG